MSEIDELTELYSAIKESARLLDVPCSHDKVWPILTAYGDALPQSVIAFRVATGARHAGELDFRFTVPPNDVDPYEFALAKGLTTETDHPVAALLSDIREQCPIDDYGIDFGVVGGFKKIWVFFPTDDLQVLSKVADIPSMPRGLAENVGLFARHGVDDKVSLIGIDYQHRTVNVYIGTTPECAKPETVLSMIREIGLPDPSEQVLRLAQQAIGIYATLNWDSSKIERITFAVMTPDPMALPVQVDPKIEQFVRKIPYGDADRKFVYAVALSADGEYYKLQSYYQWKPRILEPMLLADSAKDLV